MLWNASKFGHIFSTCIDNCILYFPIMNAESGLFVHQGQSILFSLSKQKFILKESKNECRRWSLMCKTVAKMLKTSHIQPQDLEFILQVKFFILIWETISLHTCFQNITTVEYRNAQKEKQKNLLKSYYSIKKNWWTKV